MSIESTILVFGLVGLACIIWLHLIRLSELDALCDWAAATLDAHNARRHALLLDLLKALRAFSLESGDIVESVAIVRASAIRAATPQARLQAESRLDQEMGKLLLVAETSPVLRNSVVFAELTSKINQNQADILAAREQAIAFVTSYNRVLKHFPGDWLAARFHYARRALYAVSQEIVSDALPETGGEAVQS